MQISKAVFIKSAPKIEDCPKSDLPEIALIGRSNVGKSTLINMITGVGNLAKASKIPGKTQLMNYFLINDTWHLVDLPGYGYSKAGQSESGAWMDSIYKYFKRRFTLRRIFVLIDGNIPVQEIDMDFMQSMEYEEIPFDVIITKLDKLNQKDLHKNLKLLQQEMKLRLKNIPNILLSSSVKKTGKQEILDYIDGIITTNEDNE